MTMEQLDKAGSLFEEDPVNRSSGEAMKMAVKMVNKPEQTDPE